MKYSSIKILSIMFVGLSLDPANAYFRVKNESKYPVVVLDVEPLNRTTFCFRKADIEQIQKVNTEISESVSSILSGTFIDPSAVNAKVIAQIDNVLANHGCKSSRIFNVKGGDSYSYSNLSSGSVVIAFKDFDSTYKEKRVNPTPVTFLYKNDGYPYKLKTKKANSCIFGILKICNDGGLEVSR